MKSRADSTHEIEDQDKPTIENFETEMELQNLPILEGFEEKQKLVEEKKRLKNRTIINKGFVQKMVEREYITKETAEKIEQIIEKDNFLYEVYTKDRLFVSTHNRSSGERIFKQYAIDEEERIKKFYGVSEKKYLEQKNLEAENEKAKEYYISDKKLEPCLMETFEEMQNYKLSNDLAQAHNIDALNAIVQNESVTDKRFGISIELFPDTPYDKKKDTTLSRIDCYNASTNLLEVCPRDFPNTYIPERNDSYSIFAHELAHAIDYTVNKDDPSKMKLKNTIEKQFPVINSENIKEVETTLTNATKLYHKHFQIYYPTKKLIERPSFNINPEARAAEEFVSFFAQSVSESLHKLKKEEDFGVAYGRYIQKQMNRISPTKDKLFALDVMSNCSQAYISRFTNDKVKRLFQTVNNVIEEKRKELGAAEKQLEGSTVIPSTQKTSEREKNQNSAPNEKEAPSESETHTIKATTAEIQIPIPSNPLPTPMGQAASTLFVNNTQTSKADINKEVRNAEKVTQELIEKIKSGEVKVIAVNMNVDNFTEWDEKVNNSLLQAAQERNEKVRTEKNQKYLSTDDKVWIIDKDNDKARQRLENRGHKVIMFDEYLTPTGKEATPESKIHITNITASTTTTTPEVPAETPNPPSAPMEQAISTLFVNNAQTPKADINKEAENLEKRINNPQDIAATKKTGIEALTENIEIAPSGDLNKERQYNLNDRLNAGLEQLKTLEKALKNRGPNQHLTPTEKEDITKGDLNKERKYNLNDRLNATLEQLKTLEKALKNRDLNQHLTRAEKGNITNVLPSGELNEKGKYDLDGRLAAVNDNKDLLDRIDRTAAITANVGIKAIDAEKSVAVEKTGTVEVRGENDHVTDHANNNKTLIKEIQEGNIDSNTVIAIERKQYGENQGMKDIIKIANILEHNEKNPSNSLRLPEGLENTLIYQDALLYKAAKENGVTVISLEGRNLEYAQNSTLYNENREQYMTNVINEVRSKGYNVIASVGSSHVATLEKALESNQKENTGFSQIPRKLQENNTQRIDENISQELNTPLQSKIPAEQQNKKKDNSNQTADNIRKRLSAVTNINQFSTSKSKNLNTYGKRQNTNSMTR